MEEEDKESKAEQGTGSESNPASPLKSLLLSPSRSNSRSSRRLGRSTFSSAVFSSRMLRALRFMVTLRIRLSRLRLTGMSFIGAGERGTDRLDMRRRALPAAVWALASLEGGCCEGGVCVVVGRSLPSLC